MISHFVPRAGFCPNCGKLADGATPAGGESSPVPGDVSICFYCGAVNQYGPKLTLEPFENWAEVCQPELVRRIALLVESILIKRGMLP